MGYIIGILVFFLLLLAVIRTFVKIVPEYQRLAILRLGNYVATRDPGLNIIIPIVDNPIRVDMREQYLEIPHQTAITKDNAPISIDFIIFYKVVDAQMSVLSVGNFAGAAQNIAATTLRSVVGDMTLDDVLSKRDAMNLILRTKLDETTERWGVKVTNVEVREIIPPPTVQEAMTRQMSAERTRRAVVTEAEGTKSAAITVAEGNKQSAILNAEGQKQAVILAAEGERQAALLRAEGFASALAKIFETASGVDANTMSLQYLDTLKQVGQSASTKWLIPIELSSLLSNVMGQAARSFSVGAGDLVSTASAAPEVPPIEGGPAPPATP
jgi:regulator of protease activity HflC (stomatin/prohibitin superfamily)